MTDNLDHAEAVDAEAVTRWIVDNAYPLTTLVPRPRAPLADLEPWPTWCATPPSSDRSAEAGVPIWPRLGGPPRHRLGRQAEP